MKILKYQSFLNENASIDENSMKTIEKYIGEITSLAEGKGELSTAAQQGKLSPSYFISGYFHNIAAFRSGLLEELKEVFDKVVSEKRQDILKKYLKTLLIFEFRLDKMTGNSRKGDTGKRDKISTKGREWPQDKFSKSKEIFGPEIENTITNFEKILVKMKSEFNNKPVNSQSIGTKDPQVRYKELVASWKEEQKKLGKNTSPGQGTRARLMKQAKSELGIKESKISTFENF